MYRLVLLLLTVLCITACRTNKPSGSEIEEIPSFSSSSLTPTTSAVFELTDENFSDKMKTGEGLRLAYFTATWCGPCRIVGPAVDKVSVDYRGQVLMGKMDVDAHLTDAFNNITSIPTILFFKGGEEVYRTYGIVSEEYLTEVIERLK